MTTAGTEEVPTTEEPTTEEPRTAEDGILELAEEPVDEETAGEPSDEAPELEASDTDASEEEYAIPEAELRSALEALLFAAAEPLPLQRLSRLFQGQGRGAVKKALAALQEELAANERGIRLVEVSSGYQFRSAPEHAPWLRRFFAEKPPRLSRALLETISIIAYRQPVTRGEIESIRGVNCDAILTALQNRDLILATGRRDTPGRPVEYGTTAEFLELFTMRDLSELPPLPDAESLANLLKEDAVQEESEASADGEELATNMDAGSGEGESLPDGGTDGGPGGQQAAAGEGEIAGDSSDDPDDDAEQETPKVRAMAAAAGVGGTGEEPSVIDQASESGQADGTDGADSEDSQPSGGGLAPSGRGPDS
ncbi:MAG: SMC-Scp complex subunit ScpB [Candidatus Binatia bacterium]|nr:SMC-Scp complex subunit ScpB [Candidatus Binatia bacterium]